MLSMFSVVSVCREGSHVSITHDTIGQPQVTRDLSSPGPRHSLTIQGTPLPLAPRHVQTCSLGPHHTGTPPPPTCSNLCSPDCRQAGGWHSTKMSSCYYLFLLLLVNYINVLIRIISNINLIVQSCV